MRIFQTALAAACLLAAPAALAQEADPGEVVFTRQILMSEIEGQMAPIDLAAVGEEFDIGEARTRASAVSAMLAAVPYLYPEGTDNAGTADLDIPSTALPSVWENFAAFKAMADQASQMAFDLTQTGDRDAFRSRAAQLRAVCNACHASYMEVYESPF